MSLKVTKVEEIDSLKGIKKFSLCYDARELRWVTVKAKDLKTAMRQAEKKIHKDRAGPFRISRLWVGKNSKSFSDWYNQQWKGTSGPDDARSVELPNGPSLEVPDELWKESV